jgi:hypothetical protein
MHLRQDDRAKTGAPGAMDFLLGSSDDEAEAADAQAKKKKSGKKSGRKTKRTLEAEAAEDEKNAANPAAFEAKKVSLSDREMIDYLEKQRQNIIVCIALYPLYPHGDRFS